MKWAEYFLKAVIPEAEKADVRLAMHPNDPPVPVSRGSEQLMATVEHWREYLDLVRSPYNGMTFDCGVTREMGEDPVKVQSAGIRVWAPMTFVSRSNSS